MNNLGDHNLLLFELSVGGHYPEYIAHLVNYWCEQKLAGHLHVVVSPQFLKRHADVAAIPDYFNNSNVRFVALTPTEQARLKPYRSGIDRQIRAWQEFDLISQYATALEAEHIFLPYLDTRMLPLAVGKTLPCRFSGIYFRPSFHYPSFPEHRASSLSESVQHLREKLTLSRVLQHPQLETIYSLDPLAVEPINNLDGGHKAKSIPDPVKNHGFSPDLTGIKKRLGINESRQVQLLFGDLNKRKGVDQVLAAISFLPKKLVAKLCLLLVGSMSPPNQNKFQEQKTYLEKTYPVQIIHVNEYISESEIQGYFELADVVLAPYQRHIGMSGILNRAASAQKPVLSANYGLMGEITRRYKLGLLVDSENSNQVAKGIEQFLINPPESLCDYQQMAVFARQNSVTKFASTIFNDLSVPSLSL